MSATPIAKDSHSRDDLATLNAPNVTVSMTLDNYHSMQKMIAETNWVRGQTQGQIALIVYLHHILVTRELTSDALNWDTMPHKSREWLTDIIRQFDTYKLHHEELAAGNLR